VKYKIQFAVAFAAVIIAILVHVFLIYNTPPNDFLKISQFYISLGFLLLLLILLFFVYVAYLLLKNSEFKQKRYT
jgi:high-affinity Fe2+/Pb2+ permease